MRRIFRRVAAAAVTTACLLGLSVCSLASEAEPAGIVTEGEPVDDTTAQYMEEAALQNLMLSQEQLAVLEAMNSGNDGTGEAEMIQTLLSARIEMGAIEDINLEEASTVLVADGTYTVSIPVTFANGERLYVVNLDPASGVIAGIEFMAMDGTSQETQTAEEGEISSNSVMIIGGILVVVLVVVLGAKALGGSRSQGEGSSAASSAAANAPASAKSEDEELVAVMAAAIAAAEDETELVAVITAAIAAYQGTSSNGLVVRSIRRLPGSRWKNGR